METSNYFFHGTRFVGQFFIPTRREDEFLLCKASRKWVDICRITISCGSEFSQEISKQRGISQTEIQSIRSLISSSIGPLGLTNFKGEIEEKDELNIKLDYTEISKRTFKFKVDKCDKPTVNIYQLQTILNLIYK